MNFSDILSGKFSIEEIRNNKMETEQYHPKRKQMFITYPLSILKQINIPIDIKKDTFEEDLNCLNLSNQEIEKIKRFAQNFANDYGLNVTVFQEQTLKVLCIMQPEIVRTAEEVFSSFKYEKSKKRYIDYLQKKYRSRKVK